MIRTHEQMEFNCELCDLKFANKTLLTHHKETVHQTEKYQCDQCDYKCYSKTFMKGHVQTSHEATKYNCDKCDYNTTIKESLNIHMEKHHQNEASLKPVEVVDKRKKTNYISKRIICEL